MWYNEWFGQWFSEWFDQQEDEEEDVQEVFTPLPVLGPKRFLEEDRARERRKAQIKREDEDLLAIIHAFIQCQ